MSPTTTAKHAQDSALKAGSSQSHPLAALGDLLRFMIRRDRVRAPVWVLAVVGIFTAGVGSVIGLYSTPAQLQNYGEISSADAAIKAIAGPGHGLEDPTQGAVVMNEMGLYTLIAISLMCLFLVVRHTRSEEDSDRAELVRSAPVGRYATLTAASLWVSTLNLLTAVGVTAGLLAFGLETTGSLAFGAAAFGIGMVFVGIGGVAAQVATSGRSATAVGGAILGAFFLLRAVGDVGPEWVRWLSPLGWAQGIRPYAQERWWVLLLLAAASALLLIGALRLQARRDLGAGFLRQRQGPAAGSPRLSSPLAMAARLQRGAIIGWSAAIGIAAFFFGLIANLADNLLENEAISDFLVQSGQASPTDSFLATMVLMLALLASGFTVSSVLRLRTDELGGHGESTLAGPVSRARWARSHLLVSTIGSVLLLLLAGLMLGVGYAVQIGDASEIMPLVGAAMTMLPPLLVLSGVGFALFGLSARLAPLAWFSVAFSVVVGLLAETLDLPQWLRNASPFEHVAAMPAESFAPLALVVLLAIAAALIAIGAVAVGRRDIG